jgi:maleate isomerase
MAQKIQTSPDGMRFDAGRHPRGRIGFVILAMEQTVEDDVFTLTPEGVGMHFARIPMSNQVTRAQLAAMAPGISEVAGRILPEADLDALCYTCSSGVMVIGEQKVFAALRQADPKARPTTVMTGSVRALRALNAKNLVVMTPYLDEVNENVRRFLTERDFDILDLHGLNITDNSDVDRLEPGFIREYARGLDRSDADAVFICCGALRSLDIVGALEQDLKKPVVVSNQAMMWDVLRLCGIEDGFPGYGNLFEIGLERYKEVCQCEQ